MRCLKWNSCTPVAFTTDLLYVKNLTNELTYRPAVYDCCNRPKREAVSIPPKDRLRCNF